MSKIAMVSELEALPEVMRQAENVCTAVHVSFTDFLRLFDEEVHGKIRSSGLLPGMTHVVCFEVLDMWSSRFGHRVALVVGTKPEGAEIPSWPLETVLGTRYFRLGDLPSRFQYPVAYASLDELRASLPPQGGALDARPPSG